MTHDQLKLRLAKLSQKRLADFLADLARDTPGLSDRVEALALSGEPKSLATLLRKRLTGWKRGRRFIEYRESSAFAAELSQWLDDVAGGLLESDPKAALGLVEAFICLDERILGRADDSNGLIGDAFRQACRMWHVAASKLPASPDWVKRVHDLHGSNDYGVRDGLLDDSALRLSELELRRLAKIYAEKAGAPPTRNRRDTHGHDHSHKETSEYSGDFERDWEAHSAATSMGQVARALKDAGLYEKSLRMRSPQLNTLQAEDVARQYLAFGPVEKAIPLLEFSRNDHRELGTLDLLAEAYEKLGDSLKLLQTRKRLFELSISSQDLAAYLECLPEAERAEAKKSAIAKAKALGNPFSVTRFMLDIGEPVTAARTLERASGGLIDLDYVQLLRLAKDMEEQDQFLPAALCYRVLLDQILEAARSKAYGHASRYVAKLYALDNELDAYGDFPDHAAFMSKLREQHGRKHAFWRRVEEIG